jgi:TM2 domain-containing membrane protein YozV
MLNYDKLCSLEVMAKLEPAELMAIQEGLNDQQRAAFMFQYSSVKKNRDTGLVLSILLGEFGIDRFYAGDTALGIFKLFTFGGCLLFWFIDLFLIKNRIDSINRSKAIEIKQSMLK